MAGHHIRPMKTQPRRTKIGAARHPFQQALLTNAKPAAEVAIEEGEAKAMEFLKS